MKKSVILLICFFFSITHVNAYVVGGSCGLNLRWSFDTEEGTLVIEGYGEMSNYDRYNEPYAPWSAYRTDITDISLPEGLTSIGDYAFYGCEITSIDIPGSVSSIGKYAFESCYYLTEVTLPEGLTIIREGVFSGTSLASITIPESVTTIERYVFESTQISSLAFSQNIISIADEFAWNFHSLEVINVDENNPNYCSIDGALYTKDMQAIVVYPASKPGSTFVVPNSVTTIRTRAFWGCQNLVSIELPSSLTEIGMRAFESCQSLASIIIPESVTSIGGNAFDGCTSLPIIDNLRYADNYLIGPVDKTKTTYTIKDGTRWINDDAFAYCQNLTTIRIPNSVTTLGGWTFYNCYNLTSVTIGSGVTTIGVWPFHDCNNLSSIYCYSTTPPVIKHNGYSNYDPFLNVNKSACFLYVPAPSKNSYKNAFGWKSFSNIQDLTSFNVEFQDWDGTSLLSTNVLQGDVATAPIAPTREGYTFIGWNKDFSLVTEDMTITALYKMNRYYVQFLDWDSSVLKADSVDYNSAAVAPAEPTRDWYTFSGWDKDFDHITTDLVVTAQYTEGQTKEYTIIFTQSTDGSEITNKNVSIPMPFPPIISGFTFLKWKVVESDLSEGINIQAIYTANVPTEAPAVYTNPANPAQKLIRNGNVYILTGDKTYTVTGQEVK